MPGAPLHGAAAVCAWGTECACELGCWPCCCWVPLLCALGNFGAGAATELCAVGSLGWVLVPLQVAAGVCAWDLWCWCHCRLPLVCALGTFGAGATAGLPLVCALGTFGAGAAARCRCCVRLGAWVLVPLQGAAAVSS